MVVSHTITVRLDAELAEWLEETAKRTGLSQGQIVREQLRRARESGEHGQQPFMRWAGAVAGPRKLSSRKGFSTK